MATPVSMESLKYDYPIGGVYAASMARNQKIAVYSGPGHEYMRAANGKAMVSTNDWVDCFGKIGDWYLIEYSVNNSRNRRGFISRYDIYSSDAMNQAVLPDANVKATVKQQKITVTDDPRKSQSALSTLKKGQEVTIHFFDGDWACVSAKNGSVRVYGYVKASQLELDPSVTSQNQQAAVTGEELLFEAKPLSVQSVYASTFIDGSKTKWVPESMLDGNDSTSWQFRTTSVSRLSDVYVDFTLKSPSVVTEVWIRNGYLKITEGKDQYWRNGRLAQVEVSFRKTGSADFADTVIVNIEDERRNDKNWTRLPVGMQEHVEAVRVRVRLIYTGSKFKEDVAVSEMRIAGSPQSAAAAQQPSAAQQTKTGQGLSAAAPQQTQSSQALSAVPQTVRGRLTKNNVNLRKTPSTSAAKLGRFKEGTTFDVLGKTRAGSYWWYKVNVGGKTGYFRSDMVSVDNPDALPEL